MPISRCARGFAALVAALFLALPALAGEPAELELTPGYVDPKSGVKVEEIVVLPEQQMQAVHLAVPRSGEPVEEMVVTAKRPSGEPVLQLKPHEFVRDYDNNYYGLVIYLGRNETMPLRLYMDSAQQRPGAIQP